MKFNFFEQVLFSCAGKFDPHKYTSAHMVRVHSLVTEALMDDEVNQINGYTYINDESGFQMAHISLWSLTDVRNILRCIQVTNNTFSIRKFTKVKLFQVSEENAK